MENKTIEYRFGRVIRRRRRELDLSQEELAERSGLHRNYISGIETGTWNPSLKSIERLAKAPDTSISRLMSECDAGERDLAGLNSRELFIQ